MFAGFKQCLRRGVIFWDSGMESLGGGHLLEKIKLL